MLPLIAGYRPESVLVWRASGAVTQAQFLAAAVQLARTLPDATHAINLCEDRYRFMLAFAALCLRGQTSLLPPSTAPAVIAGIVAAQPRCYILADQPLADAPCEVVQVGDDAAAVAQQEMPLIAADHVAAIAYTSGSTGVPQAHAKAWRTLVETVRLSARRFMGDPPGANIVATVPAQHMYGLETTVMMALAGGCAVHAGRPFFPRDLADALAAVPAPRVLIATPLHLRACLAAGVGLPPLRLIISATAPMTSELAAQVEAAYGCELQEIYGCTEAGSMAARRTVAGEVWQLHAGMHLQARGDGVLVHAAHLPAPLPLNDQIEIIDDTRFRLLGRSDDMLKVAGKRASLADLNARLLAIAGVDDGVVFMPDAADARPAALVVAPGLTESEILAQLARSFDPVLLPRPLLRVSQLPRNQLGKLPRAAMLAMLEQRHD